MNKPGLAVLCFAMLLAGCHGLWRHVHHSGHSGRIRVF